MKSVLGLLCLSAAQALVAPATRQSARLAPGAPYADVDLEHAAPYAPVELEIPSTSLPLDAMGHSGRLHWLFSALAFGSSDFGPWGTPMFDGRVRSKRVGDARDQKDVPFLEFVHKQRLVALYQVAAVAAAADSDADRKLLRYSKTLVKDAVEMIQKRGPLGNQLPFVDYGFVQPGWTREHIFGEGAATVRVVVSHADILGGVLISDDDTVTVVDQLFSRLLAHSAFGFELPRDGEFFGYPNAQKNWTMLRLLQTVLYDLDPKMRFMTGSDKAKAGAMAYMLPKDDGRPNDYTALVGAPARRGKVVHVATIKAGRKIWNFSNDSLQRRLAGLATGSETLILARGTALIVFDGAAGEAELRSFASRLGWGVGKAPAKRIETKEGVVLASKIPTHRWLTISGAASELLAATRRATKEVSWADDVLVPQAAHFANNLNARKYLEKRLVAAGAKLLGPEHPGKAPLRAEVGGKTYNVWFQTSGPRTTARVPGHVYFWTLSLDIAPTLYEGHCRVHENVFDLGFYFGFTLAGEISFVAGFKDPKADDLFLANGLTAALPVTRGDTANKLHYYDTLSDARKKDTEEMSAYFREQTLSVDLKKRGALEEWRRFLKTGKGAGVLEPEALEAPAEEENGRREKKQKTTYEDDEDFTAL